MKALLLPVSVLITCLFSACRGEVTTTGGGDKAAGTGTEEPWKGDLHGEPHPLGDLTVGAHTFKVIQEGDIEAGAEAAFDIELPAGASAPGTLRAWIGIRSGTGSRKARLTPEDGEMHAHLEVPAELSDATQLWIEIESDAGKTSGAIDLHR